MWKWVVASVAACALAAGTSAQAAESWASGQLKYVYPLNDGGFVISLTQNPASCASAANPKYLHVRVGFNGVTADGVKAMLATALTAIAAGNELQIAFDDSTPDCNVNRLRIVG